MTKIKPGLGKGLDLLIPDDLDEAKDAVILKLSQIEPNKDQPRKQFDDDALAELASSIKQYGVIQPIIVTKRNDYYEIIAGERRWRAARKAGLKEIPVIIREYTDKEIAEISLIENIQREDLNPLEEAAAYKQLTEEYNLTQEELAERVSKSRAAIANTMRLLKLSDDVQEMLKDGRLSAGHARALLAVESKEKQNEIAGKIIEGGLSVRQTEDLVKAAASLSKKKKTPKKPVKDIFYKDIEKKMTQALGTRVNIKRSDKASGKIEISYFSEDELDRIYMLISGSKV